MARRGLTKARVKAKKKPNGAASKPASKSSETKPTAPPGAEAVLLNASERKALEETRAAANQMKLQLADIVVALRRGEDQAATLVVKIQQTEEQLREVIRAAARSRGLDPAGYKFDMDWIQMTVRYTPLPEQPQG